MVWMLRDPDEATAFKEMIAASDRAAAILAATLLDARLERALLRMLHDAKSKDSGTVHKSMFRSSGPLGSFSAKIDLGFMLGMYPETIWRDLVGIKDIRNLFAHRGEVNSFAHEKVATKVRALSGFLAGVFEFGTDSNSVPNVPGIYNRMFIEDLQAKLDNLRDRFMVCAMYTHGATSGMHPLIPKQLGPIQYPP